MSGAAIADDQHAEARAPGYRPLPRWLLPPGHFLFKHRNWVFPVVFLALVGLCAPSGFLDAIRVGPFSADVWVDALAILLVVAGQLLRAAVIGLAYIQRGGRDGKVHAEKLVTAGFFAHSRNPLYVGNYLAAVGLFLIYDSALAAGIGIAFFTFAYLAIVAAEEQFLRAKFGAEYDSYCARVPRFRLRLAGLGETLRSMRFDWRRLVRKEYGSTFSGATAVLGLLLWEAWRQNGDAALRERAATFAPIWAILVLLYVVARTLKKRGALGIDPPRRTAH
ncbi:MAG TPA: isoprenylcysteine carboxylmethyltransferase family protein [Thermoanaerobaculia bacterium]|nr:isoprenylcysteine carboxylmethyltransferase family protein [Thermoanaerobaculia bacterium]